MDQEFSIFLRLDQPPLHPICENSLTKFRINVEFYGRKQNHMVMKEKNYSTKQKEKKFGIDRKGYISKWYIKALDPANRPNIFPSIFILSIKYNDEGHVLKAIFAILVYREREKEYVVHQSYNMKQKSIKIIRSLETIIVSYVWILSKQICSQGMITAKIIYQTRNNGVKSDELIQIIKPLYGLCESGF